MYIAAMPTYTMAETIQSVQVDIQSSEAVNDSVMKRMQAGIRAAAEHIYVGRDSEEVATGHAAYGRITTDIIDRILYGYNVSRLDIQPGKTTVLRMRLEPYGDTVRSVDTVMDYGNLSPEMRALVDEDIAGIPERLRQLLWGLPLDSLDWAASVAQGTIREELAAKLPEFAVQTEITPGIHTTVRIYVIPQGAPVRKGHAEITSTTLPAALFWTVKRDFDTYAQALTGVPIAFAARHERDIEEDIQKRLDASRAVRDFGITMKGTLFPGEDTTVLITADSSKYLIRGEAFIDAGRSERNVGLRLYGGVRQGKGSWYVEADFYPEDYSWDIFPSYKYAITEDTALTYQYNISESTSRLRFDQALGRRWNVRLQHDFKPERNELGLSYDVHSYLTLEYVWAEHDNWLRVIGRI